MDGLNTLTWRSEMKTLITIFVLSFGLSTQAQDIESNCDIANESICLIDQNQNSIKVHIHNSSRKYCGLKLMTNKNFAFPKMEDFVSSLNVEIQDHDAKIESLGNIALITSPSEKEKGLPHLFIVQMTISTQTGESLKDLASRTIGSDLVLAAVPLICK